MASNRFLVVLHDYAVLSISSNNSCSNSSKYTLVRRRTVRPIICAARSCCLRHSVEAQRCVSLWTWMRCLWWGTALYLWLPRVIIIFYITSSHLLLTLFGHRPLASLYESLRNGTFYPPHKIALMCDSVTVGYCFLFAPKYKRFPHLLTCWFVIIVLRTARKLQTLTKYVAYYWLRVVRSVNSSISKWLLPSDILNYTTSNHSLILSRKFDKFRVSSFWRLKFRGYFIAFSVMAVFFISLVWWTLQNIRYFDRH